MKTYEEYTQYKIGDYVLLNITDIDNDEINNNEIKELPGKIVNPSNYTQYDWDVDLFIDFNNLVPFLKKEIVRKLTQDEIDDIETNIELKKYNI